MYCDARCALAHSARGGATTEPIAKESTPWAFLPVQVSLADTEKRAKELSFQVKMLADVAGSPGVSVCTDRWGL